MLSEKVKTLLSENENSLPSYAWPGGYPIFYVTKDNACLCPDCANMAIKEELTDNDGWEIVEYDSNWEDPSLYCDHCSKRIESAYAEDEAEKEKNNNEK